MNPSLRRRRALVLVAGLITASAAAADPVVLRMAATAPDGTGWAREVKAFARDVDAATEGRVRVKWYLGGIAGDELEALARIKRDQLDGAGGSTFCDQLGPSLRVTRVAGLLHDRAEATRLVRTFQREIAEQFEKNGFVNVGEGAFGAEIILSREPVRSLADFRPHKVLGTPARHGVAAQLQKMGITVVPLPIDQAARAYEAGTIDGFIAPPTSALAFQWSTRARYFTPLEVSFLEGCLTVTRRALDKIAFADLQTFRAAGAKLALRFDDLNERMNASLVDKLFERQGLRKVPLTDAFRREFAAAAAAARDELPDDVVPKALVRAATEALAGARAN